MARRRRTKDNSRVVPRTSDVPHESVGGAATLPRIAKRSMILVLPQAVSSGSVAMRQNKSGWEWEPEGFPFPAALTAVVGPTAR